MQLRNLCVLAQKRQFQMYVCGFYLCVALHGCLAILTVDINYASCSFSFTHIIA